MGPLNPNLNPACRRESLCGLVHLWRLGCLHETVRSGRGAKKEGEREREAIEMKEYGSDADDHSRGSMEEEERTRKAKHQAERAISEQDAKWLGIVEASEARVEELELALDSMRLELEALRRSSRRVSGDEAREDGGLHPSQTSGKEERKEEKEEGKEEDLKKKKTGIDVAVETVQCQAARWSSQKKEAPSGEPGLKIAQTWTLSPMSSSFPVRHLI